MQLTPRAKRVIDLAYEEARQLNNNYIGTEHLLLGLIREGDGLAARVLGRLGVDLERCRRLVERIQEGTTPQWTTPLAGISEPLWERFSERARRAVVRARAETTRLKQRGVGPEPLLLGLLAQTDGDAAHMLERLG